jgi:hypothetical protein
MLKLRVKRKELVPALGLRCDELFQPLQALLRVVIGRGMHWRRRMVLLLRRGPDGWEFVERRRRRVGLGAGHLTCDASREAV